MKVSGFRGLRVRGLGLTAYSVDGALVEDVWEIAEKAISKIRLGEGPAFGLTSGMSGVQGRVFSCQLINFVNISLMLIYFIQLYLQLHKMLNKLL